MSGAALAERPYDGCMANPKYLDYEGVAAAAGITVRTARRYNNEARARERAGSGHPYDLPKPDFTFGQSPAWAPETIQKWLSLRPGRGVGGGPKKADA